ncbi:MAG: ribulose-phosphate 3-epimerase [Bacilli bacterium]|nr:ribulose-phosphate 3-epimerase [Bacilli bacterium]
MKIAGSFLKINDNIEKVKELNEACNNIHMDIMDGVFTEKATIPFDEMKEINKVITKPKDIHLMVKDIYKYIDLYKDLKPNYMTFHYEAVNDIENVIDYIKSMNIKVGLAINPNTDVTKITKYLNSLDLVLVMSVFPGKGGQEFIDITDKINYLDEYRKQNNLNYIIEVDGGINDETISFVKNADLIVVGSYITDSDNYFEKVKKLRGEL